MSKEAESGRRKRRAALLLSKKGGAACTTRKARRFTIHARADDKDHELARRALQAGEVLPLRTLLERLAATHPGEVLEVELERDDGRWIYELKLLQPGGELRKLKLDARSGELLQDRLRRAAPAARADNRER